MSVLIIRLSSTEFRLAVFGDRVAILVVAMMVMGENNDAAPDIIAP